MIMLKIASDAALCDATNEALCYRKAMARSRARLSIIIFSQ